MNFLSDLGEQVSVWTTEPVANTLPDMAFVPVCENGIEFNTDYEPVVYKTNRVLMEANAAQELNELQERNHATTAYSTLDCVATPLFPTFNAQRGINCERREDKQHEQTQHRASQNAVNAWFQQQQLRESSTADQRYLQALDRETNSFHMAQNIPNPHLQRVDTGSACGSADANLSPLANVAPRQPHAFPPRNALVRTPSANIAPPKPLMKKLINSVRGSVYDLQNIKSLPPSVNGATIPHVIKYTLTRDKRAGYLLLAISIVLLLILLACLTVKYMSSK
jgi:hypothetical protein